MYLPYSCCGKVTVPFTADGGRWCSMGPNPEKLELQLPKAAVGGLNRSLLGCMDLRRKRLEQAAVVGSHRPPPSVYFTGVCDPRGIQNQENIQVCASHVPGLSSPLSCCLQGPQTPVPAIQQRHQLGPHTQLSPQS